MAMTDDSADGRPASLLRISHDATWLKYRANQVSAWAMAGKDESNRSNSDENTISKRFMGLLGALRSKCRTGS